MKLYYYYKDNTGKLCQIEDENCVIEDINPVLEQLKTDYNTNEVACIFKI